MVKYFQLGESVIINYQNKSTLVDNTDPRYASIMDAIKEKALEKIPALLSPSSTINHPDFVVQDGLILYRGQALPTVLGEQFLAQRGNPASLIGVANFWFNLRNRTDQEQRWDLIVKLIQKQGYAITDDGFLVVYDGSTDDIQYDDKVVTPFYNYSHVNPIYRSLFKDRKNLNQICEEVFGFVSKKLLKLVKEAMFPHGKHFIQDEILNLGTAFKGVLSPNNLFAVMESKKFPGTQNPTAYQALNRFWKEYAKNKDGTTSEKKILNVLASTHRHDELVTTATMYAQLNAKKPMNMVDMNLPNSVNELYQYFAREIERLNCPEVDLEITKNFPLLNRVADANVDGKVIKLPQTNYDLKEWTRLMDNCIHGYDQAVKAGDTIVMAVLDAASGKMLYNIEIQNQRIRQFVCKSNRSVKKEEREPIIDFLMKSGIIISRNM